MTIAPQTGESREFRVYSWNGITTRHLVRTVGWPFSATGLDGECGGFDNRTGDIIPPLKHMLDWKIVCADVGVALFILVVIAVVFECLIRRRSSH